MWSGAFDVRALLSSKKYSQINDCNWESWLSRNVDITYKNWNEMLKYKWNEITKSK